MLNLQRIFKGCLVISSLYLNVLSAQDSPPAPTATDSEVEAKESPDTLAARFPRELRMRHGLLTVHAPQVEDHDGYKEITAWSAASYKTYDESIDIVGAIKIKASMLADFESRTISIFKREIIEAYFPELEKDAEIGLSKQIQESIKDSVEEFPLDILLAQLSDKAETTESVAVSMEAPKIYYSSEKALLVNIDGDPMAIPVAKDSDLHLVVNSTWDLFQTKKNRTYYLLIGRHWLKTKSLNGTWVPAGKLPKIFKALPEDPRFETVKKVIPGDWIDKKEIPTIYTSTIPSELILTEGEPQLEAIDSTPLSFISNTTSDIIFDNESKEYFVLLSGRWFHSSQLKGPWDSVEKLPKYFADIPDDHPRSHVRASIPETIEARFAILEAQVPKTAVVDRSLESPTPVFFGEAKFEPIEETSVSRATNTNFDVFMVAGQYYLCHDAVWFTGPSPEGPWGVIDSVPDPIYTIPVTSPSHHVTYVTVEDSPPSMSVHFSYTSGYHHGYVSSGVVVYGSGYQYSYYYDPFFYDPFYPYPYYGYYYYPPVTYGSASFYNPRTGTYGHGHYALGPYGGTWAGERYNPNSGRYTQNTAAWDYNSAVYEKNSYNPRTDIATSSRKQYEYYGDNSYDLWSQNKVQRGDDWIKSDGYANENYSRKKFEDSNDGKGGRLVRDDNKTSAYKTGSGDLYAGRNGNVYRKGEDGTWEKRQGGEWDPIERPTLNETQKSQIQERASSVDPDELQNRAKDFDRNQARERAQQFDNRATRERTREFDQLQRDSFNRNYGNDRYNNFQNSRGTHQNINRSMGGTRMRRL